MDLKKIKLETDRLLLIPVSMKYKYEVFKEFQEPVTKHMYPSAPKKIEETEQFIKEAFEDLEKGTDLQVHILDKKTGEFLVVQVCIVWMKEILRLAFGSKNPLMAKNMGEKQ